MLQVSLKYVHGFLDIKFLPSDIELVVVCYRTSRDDDNDDDDDNNNNDDDETLLDSALTDRDKDHFAQRSRRSAPSCIQCAP